ncbi:MAG: hypothetical protein R3A49_01920 [Acidimicrobiia bacterium]
MTRTTITDTPEPMRFIGGACAPPDGDRETLHQSFDTAALDRLRAPAPASSARRGPRVAPDAPVASRVAVLPCFVADPASDAW